MLKAPDVSIATEVVAASRALQPAVKRLQKLLSKLDPAKLPVGAVADLLYDLREARSLLGTIADPVSDVIGPAIKDLEEHFVQTLEVGEASGVQGMHSRIQITDSVVPTVEDWDKFYKHIKKTGEFELLNRAVNRDAVRERWDARKQVPGVGKFHAKKVSCTKLTGKGGKS